MKSVKKIHFRNILIFSLIITLFFSFSFSNLYTQEKPAKSGKKVEKTKKKTKKKKWKRKKKGTFKLNFQDTELKEFLRVMSEIIGKNIIIDDKVRGKITINSVQKIPVEHAYEVMKSILELKGLAVVETKSLLKIIPVKDAVKQNVEIIIDGKREPVFTGKRKTITHLLKIKHADANDISATLRSLKSKNTDIVVYGNLNMLIFSGPSTEIDGLIKIVSALDVPIDEDDPEGPPVEKGNIHVVHLENADAEQLAGVLSRIPFSEHAKISKAPPPPRVKKSRKSKRTTKSSRVSKRKDKTKLSIIANKDTNSLIITATPEEFKAIKRLIEKLDIVREQVLIEALIVEVSAETGWSLGIDWMLGHEQGEHMFGGSSIMGAPPVFPKSAESIGGVSKKIALPLATGLQIGYLSGKEMLGFALLSLSKSDQDFNILSTPQILTVDNHEAELNIGEEIPIASNNRISESGTQFYTYEYKSVGIKLKLTPHITKQKRITLDLYQEANDVSGPTDSLIPPKLSKRDISTKVTVEDGKTIVVGGLIKNSKAIEEVKVPILGDIPILGWLFKHRSTSSRKINLLIFLTPYIVTEQNKVDAVTEYKREEQRRLLHR